MLDEYNSRLSLSSLCDVSREDCDGDGITFLKKMLEDTKTMADANAQAIPNTFEVDESKEHTSMTPMVRGRSEK